MNVRPAIQDDAVEVAYIYNHYVATSHATFEMEPIDGWEMLRRMEEGWDYGYPFLVCEVNGGICGYAFAQRIVDRVAFVHTAEVSAYVKPGHDGVGIGSALYTALIAELTKADFHAVIAAISLPNDENISFHEKFGFEKVAHFRETGRKFDRWIDVGYWELLLSK